MRIFYFKTLIETEMAFEDLTEEEQLQLIKKLIEDHQISYPWSKLSLVKVEDLDGSLDW